MKQLRTLVLLALAFCASGCLVESVNPLTPIRDAKIDPRLDGIWRSKIEGDEIYLFFSRQKPHSDLMDVVYLAREKQSGLSVSKYMMFPSKIADLSYMNLQGAEGKPEPTYMFARYAFTKGNALTIWLMDEDTVSAAIESHAVKGTVKNAQGTSDVMLTADSDDLAKFVVKTDREKLFPKKFGVFERVRE